MKILQNAIEVIEDNVSTFLVSRFINETQVYTTKNGNVVKLSGGKNTFILDVPCDVEINDLRVVENDPISEVANKLLIKRSDWQYAKTLNKCYIEHLLEENGRLETRYFKALSFIYNDKFYTQN